VDGRANRSLGPAGQPRFVHPLWPFALPGVTIHRVSLSG